MRALLLSLLAFAACESVHTTESTDYDSYHMFGDRLDSGTRARVLCWPADAEGARFRCVEDRVDRKISQQPVLTWPEDVRLLGIAGSVIVILPPGGSDALRSRGDKLADDLTRGAPWAGRHFVTADASWQDIEGGEKLAARLADLHKRAAEWRSTESADGFFVTNEQLGDLMPDVIVIPQQGDADRQTVLQGIRRSSVLTSGWEYSSREILSCDGIKKLPLRVTKEGAPQFTVFEIVIPDAAGAGARERALRLAGDLLDGPETSVYLRRALAADLAAGAIHPEDLQPPYIAEFALPSTRGERERGTTGGGAHRE